MLLETARCDQALTYISVRKPSPVVMIAQQILARPATVDQLLRAEGAGQSVRLSDDRDRFETFRLAALPV